MSSKASAESRQCALQQPHNKQACLHKRTAPHFSKTLGPLAKLAAQGWLLPFPPLPPQQQPHACTWQAQHTHNFFLHAATPTVYTHL
jgi:hypothetical protein